MLIQDYPGEPNTETQADPKRYADCFENDDINLIKRMPPCGELLVHGVGIPDGYYIAGKKRSGWCFSLEDKCVKFSPDLHIKPILSCRKFLASNSCYGGAIAEHTVKGLSAYAAAQNNEPAYRIAGPVGGPMLESLFGNLFTKQLELRPPRDPVRPDIDEPKPEFDGAYTTAKTTVTRGKRYAVQHTIVLPDGRKQRVIIRAQVEQEPINHFEAGDKNCAKQIICTPSRIVPEPNLKHIECKDVQKDYYGSPAECTKNCFSPPCKPVDTNAGRCYECPPAVGPTHIVPLKLDSCANLPLPPYYSNKVRCDEECPMGACRAIRAQGEDCWQCPSITEDLPPPLRILPCPGLSSPPFYKKQDQCDTTCSTGKCRPTNLAPGESCWECPSILDDLNPSQVCKDNVDRLIANIQDGTSFSERVIVGNAIGFKQGIYKLGGDANGEVSVGLNSIQYSAGSSTDSVAIAQVRSMSALKNSLENACPSQTRMVAVATSLIQIDYISKKPVNIVTNVIPGLILPTTNAIAPIIQPPSVIVMGQPLSTSGRLVSALNPLHIVGGLTQGTGSYITHSTGYPQQATQSHSYVTSAVTFGMAGGGFFG